MIDFHIDTIFATMWHWTMVDHDWFSYWDNIFHNATLENGFSWLTMVDFRIKTIFVTMRHWTMVDHGWPWLSQCDVGPRDSVCRNVMMVIDHAWPWFTMDDFHIETIFFLMRHWNMVDHGWFSYWDNPCHNATLVDFHIKKVIVTMWCWTMVDHDYKLNGFILNTNINIIIPMTILYPRNMNP